MVLQLPQFSLSIPLTFIIIFLSIVSGITVGLSLGLIGGGGSILAVPLLVYVIGLEPHIAIGTSSLAVAVNALINILYHKKEGHIFFKKGMIFAIPGVIGTVIGSRLGLLTPANDLLILFALFMIAISIKMLIGKSSGKGNGKINDNIENKITSISDAVKNNKMMHNKNNKKLKFMVIGFLVGLGAGYFGIGGGFLIVPSFVHLGFNITDAIGTSLLPVSMFGFTTAAIYAIGRQIDWAISLLFILGGIAGGKIGTMTSTKLSGDKLSMVFSLLLIVVAIYIIIIKTIL